MNSSFIARSFGILLFSAALLSAPVTALAASETAVQADTVVDSIGVNTHFGYNDTYYYSHYPLIRQLLIDSGVRHIRDGGPKMPQWYYDRINSLYDDAGIRNIGGLGKGDQPALLQQTITSMPHLEGVESLNEYNASGDTNWVQTLQTYQPALYKAVKANPLTAHLPVIAPSLVIYWTTDPLKLGNLSQYLDVGNLHNYYSGRNPGTNGWGGYYDGYALGSIGFNLALMKSISGTKPVWTTETGYNWAVAKGGGSPDDINARYMPRLYLEQFRQGIARTYEYQFSAQGPTAKSGDGSGQFGLIDFNLKPKPAYLALKNLIAIIGDKGEAFSPSSLSYTISGAKPNVHHMLLQKRDGTFYLAIWIEAEGFDTNNWKYENVPDQDVSITLPSTIKFVKSYRIGDTGEVSTALAFPNADVLKYTVNDNMSIIEFKPSLQIISNSEKGLCVGLNKDLLGSPAVFVSCNSTAANAVQEWTLLPVQSGANTYYQLRSPLGHCLSIPNGSTLNGAKLALAACIGGSEQLWQLPTPLTSTATTLVSVQSKKCVHVTKGIMQMGTPLEQYSCTVATNPYKLFQIK